MFTVTDLEFAYRKGGEPVIESLTHDFGDGAVTAVTGPSGCGKSTLLYLLALMLRPVSGEVAYEGVDVSRCATATDRGYERKQSDSCSRTPCLTCRALSSATYTKVRCMRG